MKPLGYLLLAASLATLTIGVKAGEADEAEDTTVTQAELPAKALETIKEFGKSGTFVNAVKADEDGVPVYEVLLDANGRKLEVQTTLDGTLNMREEKIEPGDLPEAAMKRVIKKVPGAKVKAVESTLRTIYEVDVTDEAGKSHEVLVTPGGQLVQEPEALDAKEALKEDDDDEKEAKPEKSEKSATSRESGEGAAFAEVFHEEPGDLTSTGKNPYFILEPGFALELEGKDDGKKAILTVTVLDETKRVDGVETRVVEERETVDGQVVEISLNYFAISKRTNSVYYFGEDSKEYKDGKVVSQGGSWESGVKGAKYGLMTPGTPVIGSRYYQEIAPGEAMDRAEILSVTETVNVPAGEFKGCLKTRETTPLEPGNREYKVYAPGVGLLKDGGMSLVRFGKGLPKSDKP
jgi:uncharacterized membrane protein YkoI